MHRLLFLLTLLAAGTTSPAQTRAAPPSDPATAAELRTLESRLGDLQRELDRSRDQIDRRVTREVDTMKTGFDDAKRATTWALALLTFVALFGSIAGGVSWAMNRKDANRLLASEITSIEKIQKVIDLVRESFQLQLTREKDLQAVTTMIKDLHKHFSDAYASVKTRILSLRSVSRMGWSNLSVFQLTLAAGARAEFRSIPASVLTDVERQDKHEFARVCQLLGASAFYANDIGHAEQTLRMAKETYASLEHRTDHRDTMAATFYLLALIAKSWQEENRSLEHGLGEAKGCLEKAQELLKDKEDEFLVPVTLAEVESYIQASQSSARGHLKDIVEQLEKIRKRDDNQSRLLVRACLLQGNLELELAEGKVKPDEKAAAEAEAEKAYRVALQHDENSPYAMLSIALCISATSADANKSSERKLLFLRGLAALQETKALDKQELTTRATALSWAVIAAHESGKPERDQYQRSLESIQVAAVSTGGRIPLFFSPTTRKPRRFEDLLKDIKPYMA